MIHAQLSLGSAPTASHLTLCLCTKNKNEDALISRNLNPSAPLTDVLLKNTSAPFAAPSTSILQRARDTIHAYGTGCLAYVWITWVGICACSDAA